jgi:phage-related minor tail protein
MREAGDMEGAQRILNTVQRSLNTGIEARASGGPITAGRPYVVGERGPEIIVPKSGGQVIPNGATGVTINVFGDVTGQEIVEKVQDAIMNNLRNNYQIAL